MYMQRITDFFYRFSQGLTLGIGGCLLFMSSLAMIVYGIMYGNRHFGLMTLAMLMMAFLLTAGLMILHRSLEMTSSYRSSLLFLGLLFLQVFFLIFISHPMAISDPARVQNEALMMVQKQHGQMNMQDLYFQRYPNNHFIVVLFYYFYKILYFMGIQKVWVPTVILNLVSIDLGILFSWMIARRWKGNKVADMLLCLFMLCPTTYVWLTTVYTNTLSFPFVMLILYLCLRLQGELSQKTGHRGWWILLGAVMAIGYWIRPTTIIPIIAVVLYFIVYGVRNGDREYAKRCLARAVLAGGVFLCCFMGCRGLVDRHMDRNRLTGEFPITHWIMMGLNTNSFGEYSREDEVYTMRFETKEQKRQADIARIKERVKELGPVGLSYQAVAKMFGVWALADDDCFAKASYASDFPGWYPYFMGKSNTWYLLFMQAFRMVTFLFLCGSIWGQIRQKKYDSSFVFSLTFLGAVLFFVLWEANRKYNVCFMGVCLLLMADGIERGRHLVQGWKFPGVFMGTRLVWTVAVFTICCISVTTYLQMSAGQGKNTAGENVVYHCRNNPDSVAVSDVNGKEQKQFTKPVLMEQTICQGQPVKKGEKEKIILNFERAGEKKFSAIHNGDAQKGRKKEIKKWKRTLKKLQHKKEYKIEVFSLESRQKLYSRKVRNDQFSKNGKLVIHLSKIPADTSKGYVIRLRHYGKYYTMIPKVSRFPDLDPYPYGSLYMNGRKTSYDLSMSILQKKMES